MWWARILIPAIVGLLMVAGGAAATSLVREAETRSAVGQLAERRIESSEERQRLAASQADILAESARDRQRQAERWGDVAAALARIEARLDAMEQRQSPRRRER